MTTEPLSANPVIGWPRHTPNLTVTGGEWTADYPRDHLGTDVLGQVARTAGNSLAQTQCVQTSASPILVQHTAICHHNGGPLDRFRYSFYWDTGLSQLVHQTEWLPFWPTVFPFGSVPYGSPRFYRGLYADEDKRGLVWTRQTWLPAPVFCRAVKTEINATLNPAGYFQCGLAEVAQGVRLDDGIELGATLEPASRDDVIETDGGARYGRSRVPRRQFRGRAPMLSREQLLAIGFEAQRLAGDLTPFLWLPFPDQARLELQTGFLATWAQGSSRSLSWSANPFGTLPLVFDEVLP